MLYFSKSATLFGYLKILMNYFTKKPEEIFSELDVNLETGLREDEIASRQEKYGKNELPEKK